MSQYDSIATRALAQITKKGAVVSFAGGSAPIYNPATDTWSGAGADPFEGRAVQIPDNPTRFAALNLVLANPVTLLVAAKGLAVTPAPGMTFVWSGETYTCKDVEPVAPDGTAILFTVIGSR